MKITTAVSLRCKLGGASFLYLLLVSLVAWGVLPAFAQNAKLELGQLDDLAAKATEVTNIDLDGPMLKLAAAQTSERGNTASSSLAASGLLQRLKGIYVRSFEFSKPGAYSKSELDSVLKQLEKVDWKRVVRVEEKGSGETTGIYLMEKDGETVGMAIVAAEPKELTIVNLVGPINFSDLGQLGALSTLGKLTKPNLGNGKPPLPGGSGSNPKTPGKNN